MGMLKQLNEWLASVNEERAANLEYKARRMEDGWGGYSYGASPGKKMRYERRARRLREKAKHLRGEE